MRIFLILLTLILFCSCAKKPAEEVDAAIDIALTYLTDNKCQAAIDVLEEAGRDNSNGTYVQVLASAYACRAGFNEVLFLINDITRIQGSATDLMKSLTKLTLSPEHVTNSASYQDLRSALSVILATTSGEPSHVKREAAFGPVKAGDMGMQALLLSLTQLGKFLHFYGNVDALGAKGGGAPNVDEQTATPSTCFVEYNEARALTFLGLGNGGVCNNMASDDGHPNLSFAAGSIVTTKKRMCEGLMLVTNIMDILDNMPLPDDDSLGDLTTVADTVHDIKSLMTSGYPDLAVLLNTTSQSRCETLVAGTTEFNNLQFIYALLFEKGLP